MSEGIDPFGKAVYVGIASSQPDQNTYVRGICVEATPWRCVVAVPAVLIDQASTTVDECLVAFVAGPTALVHFSKPRSGLMVTILDPWPERLTPVLRAFAQMGGATTSASGANMSFEEEVGTAARVLIEAATLRRRRSGGASVSVPNVSSSRGAAGNAAVSRGTELIENSGRLPSFHDGGTDSEGELDLPNPSEAGVPAAAAGVNAGEMSEFVESGDLSGKAAIFVKLAERVPTDQTQMSEETPRSR